METQPAPATSPSKLHVVFYNERGLRAGWRLLIFAAMLVALYLFLALGAMLLRGGRQKPQPSGAGAVEPWQQLVIEFVLFLVVVLCTWVMSRLERRRMAVYGLPIHRSLWKNFAVGWIFWGFLPLTLLLLVMRGL